MATALQASLARLGSKLDDHKKDAVSMKLETGVLVPYKRQIRKRFDEAALKELADSIKSMGVLEPLLVRPLGEGKYEIIAGERRWRAARMAGLTHVPVLMKPMDDALAYKVHRAENIQRENLDTLDLAQSVEQDFAEAKGDFDAVMAQYNKTKSWISKLLGIAQGGSAMIELVDEGVTSDRAVLSAVSSLERKAPEQAKELTKQLKEAPSKSNKRVIAERFMKERRAVAKSAGPARGASKVEAKASPAAEPAWRVKSAVERGSSEKLVLTVELSPVSIYADEFKQMSRKYGEARLAAAVKHPSAGYAIVEFGAGAAQRRTYRADELRLLTVR